MAAINHMEPTFLSLDEVLQIHAEQIERYGGSAGIRDPSGLESTVTAPLATFEGQFLHRTIEPKEFNAGSHEIIDHGWCVFKSC